MISSLSFALLLALSSPVQAAPQAQAAPAAAASDTAPGGEARPETRRVCRFETLTGSNRRTRVCRDVPRQGAQDQATRDFMRDSQRVRTPDVG